MKALDIIKVVANQEWGADKEVLLNRPRADAGGLSREYALRIPSVS